MRLLTRTWYYCVLLLLTVKILLSEVLPEKFVIRLKDMGRIIHDQRDVISNLTKVVEEVSLKSIVQEQRKLVLNCSSNLEEVKGNQITMEHEISVLGNNIRTLEERTSRLETDISFSVTIGGDKTVNAGNIVKFTNVISNNGQEYVTNGVDEGKFIPPYNGTYAFIIYVMNIHNGQVESQLRINGNGKCSAYAKAGHLSAGSCSAIFYVTSQDEVYVTAGKSNRYHGYTGFTGHLIGM